MNIIIWLAKGRPVPLAPLKSATVMYIHGQAQYSSDYIHLNQLFGY